MITARTLAAPWRRTPGVATGPQRRWSTIPLPSLTFRASPSELQLELGECSPKQPFKEHISALKTQCKEAFNLIWVVAHLKWEGTDTLLMLYRTIVRSKLDYGGIVYGTASNANLRQLYSVHNAGLKTGTRGILHQPSLQYVHGGQQSSFGGTSVEVRELLSEKSCLHWRPSTSCTTKFEPTTRDQGPVSI